ncbi:MAG TPA: redoxin domain-containing protein, partial [Candidatus Acidoferrum sp.]|nr:redoxin domain-containing protein [Candidatus Acidoferrum sp.]
ELVVLSPQKSEYSAEMQKAYRIGFPMLRDLHNDVAAKFGIAFTLPDYLDDLYRNTFGNDPVEWNDTATWQLPMPARFIIRPDGTIEDAQVNPDYTVRPEPETILDVLRTIEKAAR